MMDQIRWSRGDRGRFPRLYPILDAELVLRGVDADSDKRRNLLRRLVRELSEMCIRDSTMGMSIDGA